MTSAPLATPIPTPSTRASALRRALLFSAICAPIYLVPSALSAGHPAVMAAIVIGVTWLFLRSEARSLAVLGLDPSWRRAGQLAAGWAGGALLMIVVALCAAAVLPFPWMRNPLFSATAAGYSLLWLLCGNAVEELVFRGYSFERFIAAIGHWPAQIVTALLFAVFHVVNGWPWQVALVGTTVGSVLFALVFIRWRSVPAAAGVHAATNWVRDLLLSDPPTAKTLFAPLAPRPWTSSEQLLAMAVFEGLVLLTCIALWRSIRRRPPEALPV
jgi:membrane protease YdiL (CAAX protease family)